MASTAAYRRSPAGRTNKVETLEVEQNEHPKVYDARLVGAADNLALMSAMVLLLVGMGLSVANLIVLDKGSSEGASFCDFAVGFQKLFLGFSVALVFASVVSLFALIFSYPGSSVIKYKVPSFYTLLVVAAMHYIVGGVYGTFVWAVPPVDTPIHVCTEQVSYKVLMIDVISSHVCVGVPLIVFTFLWVTGSPLVRNIAAKFPTKSSYQVNRYVL